MLIFQIISFGQTSDNSPINTENQLFSKLVSLNEAQTSQGFELLRSHKNLISKELCLRLVGAADHYDEPTGHSKRLSIYQIANEAASILGNQIVLGYSLYKLGLHYFMRNEISSAERVLSESTRIFEKENDRLDLVNALSELGNVYLYEENYALARECSLRSIDLAKRANLTGEGMTGLVEYGVAVSLLNLGDVSKGEGAYQQAIDYFQQARKSFQTLSKTATKFRADLADAYSEIGRTYRVMGDNRHALSYLNLALNICKDLAETDKLASVLNSIGVLYSEENDYDKASSYYDQSLAIHQLNNDNLEIARLLINKGVVAQRRNENQEASKDFMDALARSQGLGVPDLLITAMEGLGAVYEQQGNYAAALDWLGKALTIAKQAGNNTRIAELKWRESKSYYLKNELSEAISSAQAAVDLATVLRLPVISYLALTAEGKYYLASNNRPLASQALSKAIQQVEMMRTMVPGDEQTRQIAIEDRISPYNLMVKLLVSQGDMWNALRSAEMSKSRVLDDVLSGGRIEVTKSMTEQEKQMEKNLNRDLGDINSRIRNETLKPAPNKVVLEALRSEAQSARVRYDSFMDVLYASHPELKIERGLPAPLTRDNLAELTGDSDTVYLEYVVTDDQLYMFAISRNQTTRNLAVDAFPINITRNALGMKIEEFHKIIAEHRPAFAEPAQDLFNLLIGRASNLITGKKKLCIIPDDVLWNLPFQALQSKNDRYLIEDYVLSYAPSITALREMSRSKKWEQSPLKLLALAHPSASKIGTSVSTNSNASGPTEGLVDAETEVREIEKTFGQGSVKVLIGQTANENLFKSLAPSYSVIHIATHGVIDNAHPLYSYLLLAKTDDENDGYLEAREIMNLDLHADLTVLSACETARGKIGPGEGVIGLSWAFFVAGSRTTIVSQWKVSSASTSMLMRRFYKNLSGAKRSDRLDKAEALRKATLETMNDPRYSHPFYWAAFVMVGSNQ